MGNVPSFTCFTSAGQEALTISADWNTMWHHLSHDVKPWTRASSVKNFPWICRSKQPGRDLAFYPNKRGQKLTENRRAKHYARQWSGIWTQLPTIWVFQQFLVVWNQLKPGKQFRLHFRTVIRIHVVTHFRTVIRILIVTYLVPVFRMWTICVQ